jgi:flavin-dependent dehydrogenase
VAIVGGGPAGCSAALKLLREGIADVCLIDRRTKGTVHLGETLLPDSRPLLQELGIWESFLGAEHSPCLGCCSAWGSDQLGFNDFLLNRNGCGWHLDRARFDAFLLETAARRGVRLLQNQVVACATKPDGGFRLRLANAEGNFSTLDAQFVVDATGRRAAIARQMRARRKSLDRLTFLYGFFDSTDASSALQMTMVEATENGWWYLAPLPENRVAVAFATDSGFVRDHELCANDRWLASLRRTRHVASRLEGCRFLRGRLAVKVASSALLDPVAGPSWFAVGDACASYDPICAHGIHRALETGLWAARSISGSLASGKTLTSTYADSVISDFEEYRFNRQSYYDLERRWLDSPFWRHRRRAQNQHPRKRS